MVARLEKAPAYLAQTRERVTDPVRLWTEIDLESTEQLPAFLDTIVTAAGAEGVDDEELRDKIEAESLFELLEQQIVPLFYDRAAAAPTLVAWRQGRCGWTSG